MHTDTHPPIISHSRLTSSYELSFMLDVSASVSFERFKQCRRLITACGWRMESELLYKLAPPAQAVIHEVASLQFASCSISNDGNSRFDLITAYTVRWDIRSDSPVMTREMWPLCGSGGSSKEREIERQAGRVFLCVCVCVCINDLSV